MSSCIKLYSHIDHNEMVLIHVNTESIASVKFNGDESTSTIQ